MAANQMMVADIAPNPIEMILSRLFAYKHEKCL